MQNYVVITGASAGIGYSAAKQFAKRQQNLILIARREANLLALKTELAEIAPQIDVVLKVCDLTQLEQLPALFAQLDNYFIECWINNAGFGYYTAVGQQSLARTRQLLQLNVEALTLLSVLYVQKYQQQSGTQLINISSAGGYTMVPNAVTYCASKFYVSAFTEGLSLELQAQNSPMQVKVLAPAATKTEFEQVANAVADYDYAQKFVRYHTSDEMAAMLLQLYDSQQMVGHIDRASFTFQLSQNRFAYAGDAAINQR